MRFPRWPARFWGVMCLALVLMPHVAGAQDASPATVPASVVAEVPHEMRLFLLLGDVYMSGRGVIEPRDTITNPRIWVLNQGRQWKLARDPLHFDKDRAGVGLGSEFARLLVKSDSTLTVGLIPCAVSGSRISDWAPDGTIYNATLERAHAALKNGTLGGILWLQGQADRAPDAIDAYPDRFATFIDRLRTDLNAPDTPVVIGEIGRFSDSASDFNTMLPSAAAQVPNCVLVTSQDLNSMPDKNSFDAASVRTMGARYAATWLELRKKAQEKEAPETAAPPPPETPAPDARE